MEHAKTFFLPWQGEFGWFICTFIRSIHTWNADFKVIACHAGQKCLFPTANEFFHDFSDLVPDRRRSGVMATKWVEYRLRELEERIRTEHPRFRDHKFVLPFMKNNCFTAPRETVRARFTPGIVLRNLNADVAVTPRQRAYYPNRNLPFWQAIVDSLRAQGLTVAALGRKDASLNLRGVVGNSWDYDDVDACVELMQNARVVLSQNTGLAHFAVFLKAPMIMMRTGNGMICWMNQQRDADTFFQIIEPDPKIAVRATLDFLSRQQRRCSG